MHPVIRVFSVIVALVFLATPVWDVVLFVLIFSLGLLVFRGRQLLRSSLKMLWRLKWLYLSIFIVYGWFTPGEAVVTLELISASYLPTVDGLQAGALRVAVLIAIVSMVSSLLQTIEKEKLVSAIIWLTLPLKTIGLDTRRFALLLVLTLDKVLVSETTMRECLQDNKQQTGLMSTASTVIVRAVVKVEKVAGQGQAVEISLDEVTSPPLWQWFLPLMLAIVLYILSY
jgi:energy-coupling factor transport system permease protein